MTETPAENIPSRVVAFRDARWKTRSIVIGLAVLAAYRSLGFVDREWLVQFPVWLLIAVTMAAPAVFLLIFPLLTRDPHRRATFGVPAPSRWLTEFAIAVPVVLCTLFVLGTVIHLVEHFFPGTSLTSDLTKNMAQSPNRTVVYLTLIFMFTVAPVAEELFFRGFLYNAFRARMPLLVAALAQSLIFGFAHFYTAMQNVVIVVLGLVLTAVYEWRKTLVTPILVHSGVNFVAAVGTVVMMIINANTPVMGIICDPDATQCVILEVSPNSPADAAGIQTGDIIKSIDRRPIRDFSQLLKTLKIYRPGEAVKVTLDRSGTELEVTVVLRRRGDL